MNVSHAEILARDIVSWLLICRPGMFSLISIYTNELSKAVVARGGFNHCDKKHSVYHSECRCWFG